MLATSGAQQLASELDPTAGQRHAEERLGQAQQDRRAIETTRWTPKRGHRLSAARWREADAVNDLLRAQRVRAERQHGERPFVTERELEQRQTEHLERVTQRLETSRQRAQYRGREL